MIYHVTTQDWWNNWKGQEIYESPTLNEEGFIHCSTKEQVTGVLDRYFKGQENLLLLHLDPDRLTSELLFEKATNGELFPHIYGSINKEAVVEVEML